MPRNERVFVVFVASPSDLEPERSRLEEVIRECNVTWSQTLGLRLDLVRWETHGYPGVGQDAQEVLNRELPDDYDIFVGIMWAKYGTPTGRAGSGTEEEFSRALRRFRANPDAVKIMFYFKDAPIRPSAIDSEEIKRIQQFRSSLGVEGVLHWTFTTLEDFERLLRLHLARQIQTYSGIQVSEGSIAVSKTKALPEARDEEETGYLEMLDIIEEFTSKLSQITERISTETRKLGDKLAERTKEITDFAAEGRTQPNRLEAKALIEKGATDMNQYVVRMKTEIPLFRESWTRSADAVARAALLSADFAPQNQKQVREAYDALNALVHALGLSYDQVQTFHTTVLRLPRLTSGLNRAKRETAGVLEELMASIAAGRRVILEALKNLESSLDK